ncbi:cell wall hydrolase [Tranquillimonas rosea]|uniref:cell wall hydrolase n=1 Tax=Tranquillimonas rosea TaxID=641238 RepID=UPI003BA9A920
MTPLTPAPRVAVALVALTVLVGCGMFEPQQAPRHSDVECLQRAMYFESIRSSRDGMVAVGSVVMNRVGSDDFPGTVCGVVSQERQFAPGVMSRRMTSRATPLVRQTAVAVLRGERHPMVSDARFFHAATYRAPYDNMHYVATAGGNAFYEKRPSELVTQPSPVAPMEGLTGG